MRCDYCPLCPRDDICPESENSYRIEYKNGEYGCKHPRNWVDKKSKSMMNTTAIWELTWE